MIPLQLEMQNFLSYRQNVVLDLRPVHLACISGQNGAGKSSILEGMTWALFGKGRSKSDDDVVNRAATVNGELAIVQLDFELEGNLYRVIRKKKKGGRMTLEFQLGSAENSWQTLSETKSRETQEAIEQTLNMNYDTFTNVSFFLQGKADEFTTKSAGRRKEILAELLGVNKWDRYKDRAADVRKMAESDLRLNDARIEEIERELTQQDEREASYTAAQANADKVTAQLVAQEALVREFEKTAAARDRQKVLVGEIKTRLHKDQTELGAVQKAHAERQAEKAQFEAIMVERDAILKDNEAFVAATQAFEGWQTKAAKFNEIQQNQRPFELTIEREASRLRQEQSALTAQQQRVTTMVSEREALTQTLATKRDASAALTKRLAELADAEQTYQQTREAVQKLQAERQLLEQQLGQLAQQEKVALGVSAEIKTLEQSQQAAAKLVTDLAAGVAARQENESELVRVSAEHTSLTSQQKPMVARGQHLRDRLDKLEADGGGGLCPLCGQALTEEHRKVVMADLQKEGKALKQEHKANKEKLQALDARSNQLTQLIKQTAGGEGKLQAAQQQQAQLTARLAEIERSAAAWAASDGAAQLTQLRTQLADDAVLKAKQAEATTLAQAVQGKAALTNELQSTQQAVTRAEGRLDEIVRAETTWLAEGAQQLAVVAAQLEKEDFEQAAREQLVTLKNDADAVGFDADAFGAARRLRDGLQTATTRYQQLLQAEAALKPLESAIGDLAKQVAGLEERISADTAQHSEAEAQLAGLVTDSAELPKVESELFRLREQQNEANRQVGNMQQRVAVLDKQRKNKKGLLEERAEITHRIQRLKQLEVACGRDGVQALLIEHALPDIEESANELLRQLSNGEMSIYFETQKELKSNKNEKRETLDIRISDSNGERPYENFSGGEQFRINFAIRLALSKVLSLRAGTRLQTLVIDEGFGSQDPNGQQRLIEAINAIQQDFSRILVITHVDELREAFPTKIEVSKGQNGSQIKIV